MNRISEIRILEKCFKDNFPSLDFEKVYWHYGEQGDEFFTLEIMIRGEVVGVYHRSGYDEAYFK